VKKVWFDVTVGGQSQTAPAQFVGGDLFRAMLPAHPAGTAFKVTAHAIDRAGAEVVGDAVDITVGQ
jgi:hypothetical protein